MSIENEVTDDDLNQEAEHLYTTYLNSYTRAATGGMVELFGAPELEDRIAAAIGIHDAVVNEREPMCIHELLDGVYGRLASHDVEAPTAPNAAS